MSPQFKMRSLLSATLAILVHLGAHAKEESIECNYSLISKENSFSPEILLSNKRVFFDTGASISIQSDELDDTKHLPQTFVEAETFQSSLRLRTSGISSDIDICGKASFSSYFIASEQSAHPVTQIMRDQVTVLAGRDILSKFIVTLNFIDGQANFTPSSTLEVTDRSRIPYTLELRIADQQFKCILDTGFSHRNSVFVPYNSRLYQALYDRELPTWQSYHPVSRSKIVDDVYVDDASIVGLDGHGIVFSLEKEGRESEKDLRKFCTIGIKTLENAKVTLSPDQQIASLTGDISEPGYNHWGISGLTYSNETARFTIEGVENNFSAYNSGLKSGDIIVSFNDEILTLSNVHMLRERAFGETGLITKLNILRDGETLQIDVINDDPIRN